MRIGLASGTCVFHTLGEHPHSKEPLHFNLEGSAADAASLLARMAPQGAIVCQPAIYRDIKYAFVVRVQLIGHAPNNM